MRVTRRIEKKRALRHEADELRDYVAGKECTYPAYRLVELRRWAEVTGQRISAYKAARMVRNHKRREVARLHGMIIALTNDLSSMTFHMPESPEDERAKIAAKPHPAFEYALLSYRR